MNMMFTKHFNNALMIITYNDGVFPSCDFHRIGHTPLSSNKVYTIYSNNEVLFDNTRANNAKSLHSVDGVFFVTHGYYHSGNILPYDAPAQRIDLMYSFGYVCISNEGYDISFCYDNVNVGHNNNDRTNMMLGEFFKGGRVVK